LKLRTIDTLKSKEYYPSQGDISMPSLSFEIVDERIGKKKGRTQTVALFVMLGILASRAFYLLAS
jgi:hypothetical protein